MYWTTIPCSLPTNRRPPTEKEKSSFSLTRGLVWSLLLKLDDNFSCTLNYREDVTPGLTGFWHPHPIAHPFPPGKDDSSKHHPTAALRVIRYRELWWLCERGFSGMREEAHLDSSQSQHDSLAHTSFTAGLRRSLQVQVSHWDLEWYFPLWGREGRCWAPGGASYCREILIWDPCWQLFQKGINYTRANTSLVGAPLSSTCLS